MKKNKRQTIVVEDALERETVESIVQETNEETSKESKKNKHSSYTMKKNAGMKFVRVIMWGMLIFIFLKGVMATFAPDVDAQAEQLIADFKANYTSFTNQTQEVMAFAQNFAKEYLTYDAKEEIEHKNRLYQYVSSGFFTDTIFDYKSAAKVTYAKAYRVETYTEEQLDVYVLLEVEYTSNELQDDEVTYITRTNREQTILKVPVFTQKDRYVVEDIPQIVSDSVYLEGYKPVDYSASLLDEDKADAVETSVANFLEAYYEQSESIIHYYLANTADEEKFEGINGRFTFERIKEILSYQNLSGDIVSLVTYEVKDPENEAVMIQKINLSIQESGGKFYIKDMNARTRSLNVK